MKSQRLSQRELARLSGVAQGAISEVINGKREPSYKFLVAVAESLNVPTNKVLRLAGKLEPTMGEESIVQEIIDITRQLDSETQQELLSYARFKLREKQGLDT
ncbi:MAG TPA: helix-turn-helix transcriptional regulator [Anaerolineae bacterium]|nr:helix-turn-helix transcriptional regulator [Anaerolineae bacterium]